MEKFGEQPPIEAAEKEEVVPEKPAEQKPEENPEKELSDFEKLFNLKPEELDSIPGFDELSEAQQLLAFRNFKELTLQAVEEKAIEQVREETAKAGFLGKVWHGAFRKYYLAKAEKLSAQEILKGGFAVHGEALAEVVRQTKESGVDAEWDEKGKLRILYAGRFEKLTPEGQATVDKFNKAADNFVKASSEWRYAKGEKRKFAKLENEYKKSLAELGEVVKVIKESDFEAVKYVADVDRKVRLSQFISSNGDVNGELEKIQSQPVWQKALRNTFLEKGGYMAMGFAARTVTVNLLGLVGAPLAAAGIGSWIARKRAVETLREEAKLAESGKKHSELITAVKAENLEKKIDNLLKKLDEAESAADKIEAVNELENRLNYSRFKMENGLVQYGQGVEKLKNQYSLLQKLSEAEVKAGFYGGGQKGKIKVGSLAEAAEKVEARLDQWLKFKERKVEKHVRNQMLKGALLGAGFATLGYAVRSFFEAVPPVETAKAPAFAAADSSASYVLETAAKDSVPAEILDTLQAQGVSFDSLQSGISADSVKQLIVAGVSADSLAKFGVPKDTLLAAGVPADTIKTFTVEAADSLLGNFKEKFPFFAADTTFKVDSTGTITREGWPGTYTFDETSGDLVYSGGVKADGSEYAPQVLKAGSTAEQWLEAPPEAGISPEQLKLAAIQKGEGVWHAVYRQLQEQLKTNPAKFNLKPEDLDNPAKVKAVLNKETMRILLENKIIKPDGTEIRIRDVGTKVILRPDNKIEITEGKTYEWQPPKTPPVEAEKVPTKSIKDLISEVPTETRTEVNPQLIYENISVYKGTLAELADEDYFEDLTALEQEKAVCLGRHAAAQLDQWGIKPAGGNSFLEQFEAAFQASEAKEVFQENFELYNNLTKKISSALNMEWEKASKMKMADILRWTEEDQSQFTPFARKLFDVVKDLKPTPYEKTLTLESFIKNSIRDGESDFEDLL